MIKKVGLALALFLFIVIGLCYVSVSNTAETVSRCVIYNANDTSSINFKNYDSILVAASHLYGANPFKEIMQGEHYRRAWSQPIKVPIMWLDTAKGGLQVTDIGGGTQTKSLELESYDGTIYTLRSVNKDASEYIPVFLEKIGLENIVVDGISAQHPYGATVAAQLSEQAGVLHSHPKIVFVPRQSRLDSLNENFGNKLYLLEFEPEGENNWTGIPNVNEILETDDLLELKMELQDKLQIDKTALVRARLFDFLIGDWDRHAKQWGWALQDRDSCITAIPIAVDRDNAFYNVSGIIHKIVAHKNVTSVLRPFEKDIDYLEGLVKDMDSYFLLHVNEDIFVQEAIDLQNTLTDEKIESALRSWPAALYNLDGQEIKEKIIARRKDLVSYAKEFKQIIDSRGYNKDKLAAAKDLDLPAALIACFECNHQ